ncbi:hypothetical protein D4R78_03450 [bacterium]|nr:MAG: hypothetical protein D4R78_03450 [bacterium]
MNNKNQRLFFIASAIIFFIGLLSKLPGVIFQPTDFLYDTVELAEIFSIFGLFAGLTPAAVTFWSIGIYGIPLVLIYTLDAIFVHPQFLPALLRHDPGLLVEGISVYIGGVFFNPARQLIIGRALVAIITSFAPLAVYWLLFKKDKIIAAISAAAIFLSSPYLIRQSYGFMPDAIGLVFFSFALVITLKPQLNSRSIFTAGIFLGLAIVSKFLYLAFLPVAILSVLFCRESNAAKPSAGLLKNIAAFLFGLVIPVFIFIPFIWTSPLALSKNIFGTLAQYYVKHHSCWDSLFLDKIPAYISWPALLFCFLGLISSFYLLGRKTAILLGLGFALFLFSFGKADFLLPRYILPLVPYLCIYFGIGVELLLKPFRKRIKVGLLIFILGFILAGHIVTIIHDFKLLHGYTNLSACRDWINAHIGTEESIAIPEQLSYMFVPSEDTLKRWADDLGWSYNNIDRRLNNLCLMTGMKCDNLRSDNPVVSRVFGALEQQKIFVYKMLLWYYHNVSRPKITHKLFLYSPGEYYKFSVSIYREEDIQRLFLEKKIQVFISETQMALPAGFRVISFNRYPGPPYYMHVQDRVS